MQAAHTAAPLDVDGQQVLEEILCWIWSLRNRRRPQGLQQEEYVYLEMYNNEYYTCNSESDGEGLFALRIGMVILITVSVCAR